MKHPELVALAVTVPLAIACLIGLAVSLGGPPWVPWALGLLLFGSAVVGLARRWFDERAIRSEAAHCAPEPPQRPHTDQL